MTTEEIRKYISEILIKWTMPTRQVAINEILSLVQREKLEDRMKIRRQIEHLPTIKHNTLEWVDKEVLLDFLDELDKQQ